MILEEFKTPPLYAVIHPDGQQRRQRIGLRRLLRSAGDGNKIRRMEIKAAAIGLNKSRRRGSVNTNRK
jgi:hypothetical protein